MAGGIWTNQDKIRPGAYINFETDNPEIVEIGERGIVTLAMDLSWGPERKLIELNVDDFYSSNCLAKLGFMANETEAKLLKLALQNARILKVFRLNNEGTKASKVLIADTLTATAKYPGTFGNKIAITITASAITAGLYIVKTYANGYLVDSQEATTVAELKNNDFVEFTGNGNLSAITSTLLENGANGNITNGYTSYFNALRLNKWNTLAITDTDSDIISNTIAFIIDMRENEGKYVQAVISNTDTADYEGIINNINGVVINDVTYTAAEFCAWVAGATAGATINESLTGRVVTDATEIVGLKTNNEIVEGLQKGQFLLSLNQNGTVKVEKDINSLHTFTDKSYNFSKNRIIRELDEIGSGIEDIWENTYLGKVTNNENGRLLFKASIIDFLTNLQNRGAIDEFNSDSVDVSAGDNLDAVIATLAIKPVDSMEFLYLTVNINE